MFDQLLSTVLESPIFLAPLGVLLLLALLSLFLGKGGRKWRVNVSDPKVQLAAVRKVAFSPRPLLNAAEARVHAVIVRALAGAHPDLRLMAQTSLGEILQPDSGSRSERDAAFRSINSKRLDFAVFGPDHLLRLGIEYHGSGHFQGNARQRDAVKRTVFERAGLPLVEIAEKATDSQIEQAVLAALAPGRDGKRRQEPALRPHPAPETPQAQQTQQAPSRLGPATR